MYKKKRRLSKIFLLFLIFSLIGATETVLPNNDHYSLAFTLNSSSEKLYVGGNGTGNYSSIQEAINNASDTATIFVYAGIYYG